MNTQQLLSQRDQVLITMDVAAFKKAVPKLLDGSPMTHEVALVAMHKARIEILSISPALRLASVEWLRERGYSRRGGIPLPPPGVLPE